MLLKIEGIDKAEALLALYNRAIESGEASVKEALVDAKKALVEADKALKGAQKVEAEAVKNNADNLMDIQDSVESLKQERDAAEAEVSRWEDAAKMPTTKLSKEQAAEVVTLSKGKVEAVNFVMIGVNMRSDLVNTETFDNTWGTGCALEALKPLGAQEQT